MKKYLKENAVLFLLMGCIGITNEIFFTAIYDTLKGTLQDMSLKGYSYIWMLPLYGLTALAFPPIKKLLQRLNFWQRGLVYGLGILMVEYIAGAALRTFTGKCPWEYTEGFHLHGLIRFDFYPLWVVFAMGQEAIISWLKPRVSV
jgi:Putative ABC-transporter type IV